MRPHAIDRRRRAASALLAMLALDPAALRCATRQFVAGATSAWPVLLFIPYEEDDLGFSEAAYRGGLELRRSGYRIDVVRDADKLGAAQILAIIGRHYAAGVRGFILAGAELSAVATAAAARYPRARFATLSGTARGPNVINYCLDCGHLGGALAGAVAAKLTKTKTVGYVGGVESVDGSEAQAFRRTVLARLPGATVLVDWTGDWSDRGRARQLTDRQIGAGADVVVADANVAVIAAAARHPHVSAIGWMTDASARYENVGASVIIDTGVIYRRFVDAAAAGRFKGGDYPVDEADNVWKIVWPRR